MRSLNILLCFICFSSYIEAQSRRDEKAIIKLVIQAHKPDFCDDDANLSPWITKQANIYLKTDTTLHLSVDEKSELIKKMQATENVPKWHQSNVNHIKFYTKKTDLKYFVDTIHYNSVKKKWSNIYTFYFLEFSKPVFVRNNTICFVYRHFFRTCTFNSLFGLQECPAEDELNMYIKNNGVWIFKTSIFKSNGD